MEPTITVVYHYVHRDYAEGEPVGQIWQMSDGTYKVVDNREWFGEHNVVATFHSNHPDHMQVTSLMGRAVHYLKGEGFSEVCVRIELR